MEKYDVYIKKFKIALGILAIALIVFIFMILKIVPQIQKISDIQKEHKSQSSALVDAERRLENLKKNVSKAEDINEQLLKGFFKPLSGGLDTEAAIADEFGEILQVMRENKIKARSIKYDYDPQDDNFVKNAGNRYYVCRVTADMVASYTEFENFLRDLFKHEHFLEISKIEITPYSKNKRILLINLQIKLYAMRDPSTVQEMPIRIFLLANNRKLRLESSHPLVTCNYYQIASIRDQTW